MSGVVDDIAIKLGIKAGDLKAVLTDANAEIRKFGQSGSEHVGALEKVWEKLGHRVVGTRELAHAAATALGLNIEKISSHVAELITGISEQSAKAYEKLGDLSTELTNKQIDAMRRLTSLENQITLTQNDRERSQTRLNEARAAEAAQISTTRILLTGLISPATALVEMVQRRHAIEKSLTEQVDQTLALTRATAEEDRLRTEEKKKQEQLSKMILDYNREEENHAAAINGYEAKVAALQHNLVEAKTALAAAEKGSLEQGKLVLEVQKARFAVDDAILAHKKQIAGSAAEELEVLKLVHKVTSGIATGPEELRLKQITLIRQERGVELEMLDLTNKAIAEKLTPDEEKRLAVLVKQKTKLDEALAVILRIQSLPAVPAPPVEATVEAVATLNKEWDAFMVKVSGGADYASMSDAMLRGIIAKQTSLLNTATAGGRAIKDATINGNYGDWQTAQLAQSQIAGAQAQLNQRATIRSIGLDSAIMQFGDSAVSRALAGQNSDTRNTNAILTGIAQTVNKVFPGQATSIVPIH